MPTSRVTAVVVTWNRRDLIVECLDAVLGQSRPPSRVVVVDNASTDGSADLVADRYPSVEIVRTATNVGGAGGFALGLATAVQEDCDAVWLFDDDTIPTPGALAALVTARDSYAVEAGGEPALAPPALVASRVEWTDGREHPMNTPRANPFATRGERAAADAVGCVPVRTASFVSILLDAARVREVGLPVAAYFLWNDDFEFTARLLRGRRGLHCPASVVVHKTRTFGDIGVDPGERFYFEVRNKLWAFTRSRALAPRERLVYAGSTVRRWAATFVGSSRRGVLARGLARGLRDGIRAPRETREVIGGLGPRRGPAGQPCPDPAAAEPFSVLLPVYAGDDPDAFEASLRSVTQSQTLRPAEVVVVRDGPVPAALESRIHDLVGALGTPVHVVPLAHNVGLGRALAAGLAACAHDIVARQDADDISLPDRFGVEVPLVCAGWDVVGSALVEFDGTSDREGIERVPPLRPASILRDARFAQPVFHPTLVYRRSVVERAGGYEDLPLLEDYWLVARMILAGARIINVPEPLVRYRVSEGAYARRGGRALLRSEIELQRRFHRAGFTTTPELVRNLAVRGTYRLVPERVRRAAYGRILAQRGHR